MQEHSITAIIYDKKGRPLAIGKNSYVKTHPIQKMHADAVGRPYKQYIHAEIDAIIRLKDTKKAHKIFVSRIGKSGDPLIAKPCPICQRAIELAGIKVVEHT